MAFPGTTAIKTDDLKKPKVAQTTRSKVLHCTPCWWQKHKCGVTFGAKLNLPFLCPRTSVLKRWRGWALYSVTGHPQLGKCAAWGHKTTGQMWQNWKRKDLLCSRHHRVTFIITFSVDVQGSKTLQQGRAPFGQTCSAMKFCDRTYFVTRISWQSCCHT